MRCFLATLAFAGALLCACHPAIAGNSFVHDDRYFVAQGADARDVLRARRCAPPFGCRKSERRHHRRAYARRHYRGGAMVARRSTGGSVTLAGVVAPLAAKAEEIVASCGARVISAFHGREHSRVRGSGRISLHASGRAVDLSGNPGCIYAHLAQWPGGVSIDYGRVHHVHVSYSPDGREWGSRFAHYRGGTRHARRWRPRHTQYSAMR